MFTLFPSEQNVSNHNTAFLFQITKCIYVSLSVKLTTKKFQRNYFKLLLYVCDRLFYLIMQVQHFGVMHLDEQAHTEHIAFHWLD